MKLRPLNDWAVIVPTEAEGRTAGGIYIPDAAKEKPAEGVVEAIGPGALEEEDKFGRKKKEAKEKKERKFIPTSVKPGERVLYEKYAGQKITLGSDERVLVRERDILGIYAGQSSGSGAKTLLLPERTSSTETSLATLALKSITAVGKVQLTAKRPAGGKAQGKPKKKASKKTAKKAAKKTAAKPKKAAPKKGQGKAKKKTAKKGKKKR